jgi:outer membrane biosynthesis protein TonB
MKAKPHLHGLLDCRRRIALMRHEPGRHRKARRSVGAAVGTAGCLLLGLAIVVPVVLQAGAGSAGAATVARLSANSRALTPVSTPTPLPVKLPPPVRLSVTPHRAVGDLVPFDYTVRTVEDAQGEIGWALEVVEVIKPPPPAPRPAPTTPRPSTTAPQPTTTKPKPTLQPEPTTTAPTPRPTTTAPKPEPTTAAAAMP